MNQHYDQKAASTFVLHFGQHYVLNMINLVNSLIALRQERRETQDDVLDLVDMFNVRWPSWLEKD
jgi:hypothetical protein